jgi:TonB family protein
VRRTTILLTLLAAGSWSTLARAQFIVPVPLRCEDRYGREIDCPPPKPPEFGAKARREYVKSLGREVHDKHVTNLQNGKFTIVTPAQWHADSENAVEGWCVARVDEHPAKRSVFYHVRLDEKSCLATRKDVPRTPDFEPFDAYREQRMLCDSEDSSKCAQARKRFESLARTDLLHSPDIFFEDPKIAAGLRERLARDMQSTLRRLNAWTILVNADPCIGLSAGGLLCGNTFYNLSASQKLFTSDDQPLSSGVWRYRVLRNVHMRGCMTDHGTTDSTTVFIDNDSDELLECAGSLDIGYNGGNSGGPLLVDPHERRVAFEACGIGKFNSATVKCSPHAPLTPVHWAVPSGCAFSVQPPVSIEAYYPLGSRRRSEEGAVTVSFTLNAASRMTGATVVSGSEVERLREAALSYVKGFRVRTTCPQDARYFTRVRFRLDDFGGPVEPPKQP